jgi:malate synthase
LLLPNRQFPNIQFMNDLATAFFIRSTLLNAINSCNRR